MNIGSTIGHGTLLGKKLREKGKNSSSITEKNSLNSHINSKLMFL